MDIRFNHLESLNWLWAVLVVAVLVILAFKARKRVLARLATSNLTARLTRTTSLVRKRVRAVLLLLALVLTVFALLDPRWGVRYKEVQQQGIDVFFVLDTSRSMLAEDVRPNRLDRAKQYIEDVLETVGGDRVGLVTFAGQARVNVPLTLDYGAMRLSLDEVNPQEGRRGGSMAGDAIRLAMDSFTDEVEDHKAIIMLTDGEDMGSYPVEAATKAADLGIRIYTVGLGDTVDGGRIPVGEAGTRTFLTHDGREVWSKMDAELLSEVALAGDGAYIPAGTSNLELNEIYQDVIAGGAGRDLEIARIEEHVPRYQWFAALALLLVLIDAFMTDRRTSTGQAVTA
jgi:Ca-activated chloride channel family protein